MDDGPVGNYGDDCNPFERELQTLSIAGPGLRYWPHLAPAPHAATHPETIERTLPEGGWTKSATSAISLATFNGVDVDANRPRLRPRRVTRRPVRSGKGRLTASVESVPNGEMS